MSDDFSPASNATDTSSDNSFDTDAPDEDLFDDVKEARKAEASKPKPKPQVKVEGKPATKDEKEEKAAKRFIKTKVNGREESVDEDTLIREYQKSRAGDERLAKAAQIEKNTAEFFRQLQENPEAVLSHPGLSINKQALALKWLQEQVEEELEDPREKEFKTQAQKLKEYEERDARAKADAEQAEEQEKKERIVNEHRERLGGLLQQAMEKTSLSKDPELSSQALREMALELKLARSNGDRDTTPEELAAKVEARYFKGMHSVASTLSGDELLDFFGDKFLNKLRKADLDRYHKKQGGGTPPTTSGNWKSEPRSEKASKTIDPADFRQRLRDSN